MLDQLMEKNVIKFQLAFFLLSEFCNEVNKRLMRRKNSSGNFLSNTLLLRIKKKKKIYVNKINNHLLSYLQYISFLFVLMYRYENVFLWGERLFREIRYGLRYARLLKHPFPLSLFFFFHKYIFLKNIFHIFTLWLLKD